MDYLDPIDALMLAGELISSPMHVGVLIVMTPPAGEDPASFADHLYTDSLTQAYPVHQRLRRRLHRGIDTGLLWVWHDATEVDLRQHVHRVTLPPGGGRQSLWELISRLHGERLDMSAPLWKGYLIDGLPGGRFALYIKVHHILIDGVGGLQMIGESLSPDPARRSMPPFYAAKTPATGPSPARRMRLANPLAALRAVADAAAAGLDLTRKVAQAELATVLGSLVSDSVVAPLEAPRTRFNTRLGPLRSATGISLGRQRIRAVETAAGVTGNDVVTAVIAGALRAWLAARDELPDRTLVAMCPVSVRTHDDSGAAQGGNRFGLGLCPLGTDVTDPAARLALIHAAMSTVKQQVRSNGPGAMLAVMGPAIGSTVALPLLPFSTGVPPSCNLAISNVPGPRAEMFYNGAHVDEMYPVSTAFDGMGLNVTACSYADRVGVGYVSDAAMMPDIDELDALTEQALAELEDAVGVSRP